MKDKMKEKNIEISLEKMNTPSYKLLLTTPMAAIMLSGKENSEWSGLLASIAPIYSTAAGDTQGEVNEALLTVAFVLQGGDAFIGNYFDNKSLNFDRMMEISATGADVWMCKLSDGEVEKSDAIILFKTIQAGLIEAIGDVREENKMIEEFIQIQDKIIEYITSLN